MPEEQSIFAATGARFYVDLVNRFYDAVEGDPVLAPLYPDGPDTAGARERLAMFLAQYWGGPHHYMERRGHPMLRARHNQWAIGAVERDRWLLHMLTALGETVAGSDMDEPTRERVITEMSRYMVNAAEHLRNGD